METDIQYAAELWNNGNVTSGTDESPVAANQLQSMFAAFMAAMQTERKTGLQFRIEIKLSENLYAKLTSVSESLDTK